MERGRRGFVWMTIMLELSLVMGIVFYGMTRQDCADQVSVDEQIQVMEDEFSPLFQEEMIADEDVSSSNKGGPYIVAPSLRVSIYRAKNGDNLWTIARKNNLDFYTLLSINRLEKANKISIGQKVKIPNQRGLLHTVHKSDVLEDIALKYDVDIRKIIRVNRILSPNEITKGTDLFIPGAKVSHNLSKEILRDSGVPPTFAWPCRKYTRISSSFGYRKDPFTGRRAFHSGTDFAPGYGARVYASMGGRVTHAGYLGGYGKLVVIKHANGFETRYGHLSRILVRKGRNVGQEQQIGKVGNTGRSTGPHLHFEIRERGKAKNPMKFLHR